jgi:hypothetical protein
MSPEPEAPKLLHKHTLKRMKIKLLRVLLRAECPEAQPQIISA